MKLRNAKRWAKPGIEAYVVAFAGFLVAFLIRYALQPNLYDNIPLLTFAINSLVVAFLYGFWPSLWILLLSFPVALYFFEDPFNTFDKVDWRDINVMFVYFTLCMLAAILFEWLRRERYKAELIARVSDTRYRLLVEADEDRRATLIKEAANQPLA